MSDMQVTATVSETFAAAIVAQFVELTGSKPTTEQLTSLAKSFMESIESWINDDDIAEAIHEDYPELIDNE